jgi:hypothetical protein
MVVKEVSTSFFKYLIIEDIGGDYDGASQPGGNARGGNGMTSAGGDYPVNEASKE